MPAKVVDAVPVVTKDSRNAPRALSPSKMPTVAKRSTASVARVMFIINPLLTN